MSSVELDGWAVAIHSQDGSWFLAHSSPGILPAVWRKAQRRWAVAHKKELSAQGFKARVVPVRFSKPETVS